jgi:hypothetical protein
MTWTKLSDTFYDDPKVLAAGNEAVGLHARALTYCARHLTDGLVPKEMARQLGKPSAIQTLLDTGFWREKGGNYIVADYFPDQESREEVEARRAQDARRKRESRGASRRSPAGVTP